MKKIMMMVLVTMVIFIGGCVTGKDNYIPPSLHFEGKDLNENSLVIDKAFEEVWSKGVSSIGNSFFVINTIEKASGIINVSYSGKPSNYIECGTVQTEITNARGTRKYNFQANSEYQVYESLFPCKNGVTCIATVTRTVKLEGRINIVVQQIDTNKTKVVVNVKYIVSKENYIEPFAVDGTRPVRLSEIISFNTGNCDTFKQGSMPIPTKCCPNKTLERDVLDLFRIN